MKILFAIQGTGNGHISRAREIIPLLQQYGQVDLLISGTQADVLPDDQLKYKLHGFSFVFGRKGGVNHWKTMKDMNLIQLWKDIKNFPLKQYDLIVNDFEPVTAWACKLQGRPSVSLSHQASFLSKNTPRASANFGWEELVLKYYAPTTHHIGFHFDRYDDFIHTPVIRSQIRSLETKDLGHVTVYLPAYDDRLMLSYFKQIKDVQWEVFTKHSKTAYREGNVNVMPVNNEKFNASLATSSGLLTGGGFEGPAEALFLNKKVIVFPMKFQYEQLCNAEAAHRLGVPVIHKLDKEFVGQLQSWIDKANPIEVNFPNETAAIVDYMIKTYAKN